MVPSAPHFPCLLSLGAHFLEFPIFPSLTRFSLFLFSGSSLSRARGLQITAALPFCVSPSLPGPRRRRNERRPLRLFLHKWTTTRTRPGPCSNPKGSGRGGGGLGPRAKKRERRELCPRGLIKIRPPKFRPGQIPLGARVLASSLSLSLSLAVPLSSNIGSFSSLFAELPLFFLKGKLKLSGSSN